MVYAIQFIITKLIKYIRLMKVIHQKQAMNKKIVQLRISKIKKDQMDSLKTKKVNISNKMIFISQNGKKVTTKNQKLPNPKKEH